MEHEIKTNNPQEAERTHSGATYLPPVDIYEQDNSLYVVADMPGVSEKSVNVDFEKGVLTINGRVEHAENAELKRLYTECKIGDYQRSFSVPEEIDVSKIAAKVKDGQLTIVLPRSPEPEARRIPVNVG